MRFFTGREFLNKSTIFEFKKNIRFSFIDCPFELSLEHRMIVENNWKKKIDENDTFFNGSVLCLWNVAPTSQERILLFYKTDYAHYLASEMKLLPQGSCCRSFYVSSLIETNDHSVAIGKMGKLSFDPGRFQFIGGGIDMNYVFHSSIDYSRCIESELFEEVGIHSENTDEVIFSKPIFISIGNVKNKISVVFHIKLNMDSKALNRKLESHNKELLQEGLIPEVNNFIFVNDSNYRVYFSNIEESKIDENLISSLDAFFTGNCERDYSLLK